MKQTVMTDLVPEQMQPPMALDQFIARMGITRTTAWRWRKEGALRTVNIYGRVYVPAKEVAEFNRRAAAGEFQKDIRPNQSKPAVKPSRQRRLAA